ncbi:hypothetical protein Q0590_34400 [Rhodocytophaga aerolata]|uniref:Uncharacterized protein n=1 Tax=Rhodocytophaga aerolata TaxID=455078 RepID=A0ABT8RH29_9BACT|nr:hypothetical protein [Rhodocytophaga aerolata]MDO1451417.1 hypothetical protein [Rhodocytophaga aerolata]
MKLISILFMLFTVVPCLGQGEEVSFWKGYVDEDAKELNLQNLEKTTYPKAYRIWNSYQVIELIQENDSTYRGQLINYVAKINRKEEKKRLINQKLFIPESVAKTLIHQLTAQDIEYLPDGKDVKGYVTGLDGMSYQFEIKSAGKYRIYSYWEPEDDLYQNSQIQEVQKVRNILSALDQHLDVWKLFTSFRDQLPYGRYQYGGIIMTKR